MSSEETTQTAEGWRESYYEAHRNWRKAEDAKAELLEALETLEHECFEHAHPDTIKQVRTAIQRARGNGGAS